MSYLNLFLIGFALVCLFLAIEWRLEIGKLKRKNAAKMQEVLDLGVIVRSQDAVISKLSAQNTNLQALADAGAEISADYFNRLSKVKQELNDLQAIYNSLGKFHESAK